MDYKADLNLAGVALKALIADTVDEWMSLTEEQRLKRTLEYLLKLPNGAPSKVE